MHRDTYTYPCDDGTGDAESKERWIEEKTFNDLYRKKTGRHWISKPFNTKPQLYMHPADKVGAVLQIKTTSPIEPAPQGMSDNSLLTLEVLATEPRLFKIPHFLSESEVAYLVSVGAKNVKRSLTGDWGGVSETRTSKNTWIERNSSPIIEKIFQRASDLLKIDEKVLTHGRQHDDGFAESLQLVHYDVDDKYDAHYDWGVEKGPRYITLLLYLNEPTAGGETCFPRAKDANPDPGIIVSPKIGSAALFYNIMPDGNADIMSLHAALPVHRGEKWLANFWIRDTTSGPEMTLDQLKVLAPKSEL